MKKSELTFEYSENLIAQTKTKPSRVLWTDPDLSEIDLEELKQKFKPGDILVINDTRVVKSRIFAKTQSGEDFEILFLEEVKTSAEVSSPSESGVSFWKVLCPSRKLKKQERVLLPNGSTAWIAEPGLPQTLQVEGSWEPKDFETWGEMPLPPYIQAARGDRHASQKDNIEYQTAWAKHEGSRACPTASLHFSEQDLRDLQSRGVEVLKITLHVGLGTFLPIQNEDLSKHQMHAERVFISKESWTQIQKAKASGQKIWALGTTVLRALESAACGLLDQTEKGFEGATRLFVFGEFQFRVVDRLMTNFHQPESTLLALVMSFAGKQRVLDGYRWAIEREFRLFSYGDLTVWTRQN